MIPYIHDGQTYASKDTYSESEINKSFCQSQNDIHTYKYLYMDLAWSIYTFRVKYKHISINTFIFKTSRETEDKIWKKTRGYLSRFGSKKGEGENTIVFQYEENKLILKDKSQKR